MIMIMILVIMVMATDKNIDKTKIILIDKILII